MTGREYTRWHSQGITADHRPGTRFNSTGKAYKEPTSRYRGIPWNIRHYIETGEGAKPARTHVEPDGYREMVLPVHKPCVTEGCKNFVQNAEVARYCYTCNKQRCAENYRNRRKQHRKEALAC